MIVDFFEVVQEENVTFTDERRVNLAFPRFEPPHQRLPVFRRRTEKI